MNRLLVILLAVIIAGSAWAELPRDFDDFQSQFKAKASDPKAAANLWFDAVMVYISVDPSMGTAMLTEAMSSRNWEKEGTYFTYSLNDRPQIFRSYAQGTSPDNAYAMDPQNYVLDFSGEVDLSPFDDQAAGLYAKLFITSSGADTPRPLILKRGDDGLYRAWDYSSIYLDIRPTTAPPDTSLAQSKDPNWVVRRFFEGIFQVTGGDKTGGIATMASVCTDKEIEGYPVFMEYLRDRPWMFGGFVAGTSPESNYEFDKANWELELVEPIQTVNPGDETRAVLRHSGADFPKPLYLVCDDRGEYRIRSFVNVYSNCRLPGKKELDTSLAESTDPNWVVNRFFEGIFTYIDGNQAEGIQMIESVSLYKNFDNQIVFKEYLRDRPWMFGGFVKGTTPEGDYKFDRNNWELDPAKANFQRGDETVVTLKHSGADFPKPLYLVKDERGEYRIRSYANVYSNCRLPGKKELDTSLAESTDPNWVVKRFFEGIFTYIDGNQAEGKQIIESVSIYKDFDTQRIFKEYLRDRPWMFGGFVKGTTPEGEYKFDRNNWELDPAKAIFMRGDETVVTLKHSGADFPKPFYLVKDERGEYRIRSYANVYSSCRLPGKKELDASLAESADPAWVMNRFFEGIFTYIDGNQAEGIQLIESVSLKKDFDTQRIFKEYLRDRPWMFGGFVKGTTPEGEYKFDRNKWELDYAKPNFERDGETVVTLKHSGADFPKPFYLVKDERGEFRIRSYANVYSSCRLPGVKPLDESKEESTDPVWVLRQFIQGAIMINSGQKDAGLAQMSGVSTSPIDPRRVPGDALGAAKAHIWRSYVKGTSPENGYAVPDVTAIEIDTYFQPGEEPKPDSTDLKIFVRSSGADSARPAKMKKDTRGQWRIYEFSSLCTGIRAPK